MSDAEPGERVAVACPACGGETVHEVLSPGGQATVRCTDCDRTHKTALPEPETVERRVVVSQSGESVATTATVPADEALQVGEEFVVDADEGLFTARITSLETAEGRQEAATASETETIWSRAVGNVSVDVTMHPADGRHDDTESLELQTPGDHAFVVGESEAFGDAAFTVESVLVRDDARGYEREQFEHDGDEVLAKDVKRLYVRDDSSTAWSAW